MRLRFQAYGFFILVLLAMNQLFAQIKSDFIIFQNGNRPSSCISDSGYYVIWDEIENAISYQKIDSLGNFVDLLKSFSDSDASLSPRQVVNNKFLISVWYDNISTQVHYFRSYIIGNIYDTITDEQGENFMVQSRMEDPMDAMRYNPDITFLDDTTYVVVWYGVGGQIDGNVLYPWPGVYSRIGYTSGALKDTFNIVITDHQLEGVNYSSARVISHPSSQLFTISWQDDHKGNERIYSRIFYKDGTPKDSVFVVNEDSMLTDLFYLATAVSPNGEYVIVWTATKNEETSIYWKWYMNDGTALTSSQELIKVSGIMNFSTYVDVAIDKQGKTVITWVGNLGGIRTLYAQRYDEDRIVLGLPFQVSTRENILYSQIYPNVEIRNNRIYFCWHENESIWGNIQDFYNPVSISESDLGSASKFSLYQNYPNPFNLLTTIKFNLPKSSDVNIEVYNITGQRIQTLLNEKMSAGSHQVEFNAENLSSGVYFYRIEAGEFQDVKKMILIK